MFTVIFLRGRRGRERKHLSLVTGDPPAGNKPPFSRFWFLKVRTSHRRSDGLCSLQGGGLGRGGSVSGPEHRGRSSRHQTSEERRGAEGDLHQAGSTKQPCRQNTVSENWRQDPGGESWSVGSLRTVRVGSVIRLLKSSSD